jgi:hypothetical protein
MCRNAVLEVISQKDASWNIVLGHIFPGSGITLSFSNQILGPLHFGTFFKRKIALL